VWQKTLVPRLEDRLSYRCSSGKIENSVIQTCMNADVFMSIQLKSMRSSV